MMNKVPQTNLAILKNVSGLKEVIKKKEEKEKHDKNSLEKPPKKERVKPAVLFY